MLYRMELATTRVARCTLFDNYTFIIYKVNRKIRFQFPIETVEKPASERLMENVQMQGFRNPEE
jgi:hypothetical protein